MLLKALAQVIGLDGKNARSLGASLQTPVAQLSVLQQSWIAGKYPARLPRLAEGIQHIFPLVEALLAAIADLVNSALGSELQPVRRQHNG